VNLLSFHGTILRADEAGTWFHEVLWPPGGELTDLDLALPETGLTAPWLIGDIVAAASRAPGRITLRRGEVLLCAHADRPRLDFEGLRDGHLEQFLTVAPDIVGRVRALLGSTVLIGDTGDTGHAVLEDGLVLRVGARDFSLANAAAAGGRGLIFDGVTLMPGDARPVPERIVLRRRVLGLPVAIDAAMFAMGPGKRLNLLGPEELAFPPATLCDADQVWMQQNPWAPTGQNWGRVTPQNAVIRTRDAFVLMSRGHEGTVFDRTGLLTDIGNLSNIAVNAAGHVTRSGETVFVDEAALRHASFLPGPHAVFYGRTLTNYFHWLIEGLVPLRILAPHLPAGTKLLLPGNLSTMRHGPGGDLLPDHMGMLDDWGFGAMPHAGVTAPVCRVEELYWLDSMNLDLVPGADLRAARDVMTASLVPSAARRKIYVRRPAGRSVQNAAEIEHLLGQAGFETVEMRGLSHREQIALFHAACFVIAPHGAEMSNLLFCRPGTQVIELSPMPQFRPFFAQISDKLGLSHAVLPCATDDGSFQGRMSVDVKNLAALMAMVRARGTA
jgi:hypothetical protein